MASSNKSNRPVSRQALKTFWILVLILVITLYHLVENSKPSPIYNIVSISENLKPSWYLEESFESFVSNETGMVFALPVERDRLFAIDIKTGVVKWIIELPFPKGGMRAFLADASSVYIVTSIDLTAYEAVSGEVLWETELGDGHVSIDANIENNVMELHYGNRLYKIDLFSGEILSSKPGVANESEPIFRIIKDRILLTKSNSDGLCAQSLGPRKVLWCKGDFELNEMAVDEECELGYAMPNDETLWVIDLFTGQVLEVVGFNRSISTEPDEYFSKLYFANDMIVVSFVDSGQSYGLRNDSLCPMTSSKQ